jgi:hypothetical protein
MISYRGLSVKIFLCNTYISVEPPNCCPSHGCCRVPGQTTAAPGRCVWNACETGMCPQCGPIPCLLGDDACSSACELSVIQDRERKCTLALFPSLFQTALRTESKSPHILLLGLLSGQDAIGSARLDKKRQAIDDRLR